MPRRPLRAAALIAILALLGACGTIAPPPPPTRPASWSEPEALVAPSSFAGVHGLAIDQKGRLLAGSVLGNTLWEVDRSTGAAKVLVDAPEGQADDIAVGPKGELAWTNYLMGMLRYRESDSAPMRVLAKDLPGLNSLDFDRSSGKLYASQVFLGDALWEIDRTGQKPPRLIKKDMGGFNGFEVGPDGMLYGPLWFKGQVVKIAPADGAMTVIADGFKIPAAANLDGKGNLWVVDARSGELVKVDLATGRKTVARQLRASLDNLAIAPDGTIYVSNMANNEVQAFDPATGALRTLTSGKLAAPAGLKIEGHTLWVADVFGFRQVDVRSGEVRDVFRMQRDPELDYPFAVGLSGTRFALASWFTGTVQLVDRQTLRTVETIHGLKAPFDAIPMADGSVIYAEIATGSITRARGPHFAEKQVLASGLGGPVQMIVGQDGALYVTEAAGKLTRIPLDASAPLRAIAEGLALPEGVAQTPWGSFIVAESAARRLVEIDPLNGSRRTVAENLPIGMAAGPGLPPPYVVTGVAVGGDGSIYMSADRNNAIYRIRPKN
ncbi:PQQ-binding-like beta-propeller repeat protein [Variovorax paradoxus]|uniref:Virginiamycin B lyase n=1 Tax=Variovorax paradoxus TaxID=34073 RepID=A0A0H2M3S9_VARPD|nr:PQQ-binding-like beta-propeller repeat protein [Variovorax paradoxus]KLN57024.1 virginiamycin B lyase [Variovorax paradoxus]